MWFYTADTATRIAEQRHARTGARSTSRGARGHRMASALRSLADRIDTPHAPTVHTAPWS